MTPALGPCEEWPKSRTKQGYGKTWSAGKTVLAHRDAWAKAHGPIPAGRIIMHLCNNPPCVRLSHLQLGTYAENMAHMKACGRQRYIKSPRAGRKALPKAVVDRMLSLSGSLAEVARAMGVSPKTVANYRRRTG